MAITKEQVLKALSYVEDPDLGKDLVTLNMISDIVLDGKKVSFTVILTTPACPMKDAIQKACENAIHHLVDKEALVSITMTSDVTSRRKDNGLVLPGVKNIIAVASGKGGVGKSTVAVNLAIGLAENGAAVGLIDADIYGPSIPLMLNIKGQRPQVKDVGEKQMMIPIEKYGIKALSIGLLVDEKQAVVWRGPMVSSALRQFVTDCLWGDLDYLVIDLPPGTGDIHLTLVQTVPVTGAIIVTTPQDVSLADAKKAMGMFSIHPINVPIIGVVENMSYFIAGTSGNDLPENKHYIFGKGGGQKLADEYDVPLLAEIPIIQQIREGGDEGKPAVLGDEPISAAVFRKLAQKVAQHVAIRNANFESTKVVEIAS
ncbi:MAG: Mrp/NBP35 family ATP-binding protein [Chitinophagaceae bacterium]|nr:Mrp/NBP35 family ATP-binding protein [Chitinophagaceae bacterium]